MKLGVLTNLFGKMSLEEALTKFEALGIEAAEIGCGGYPGKAHCDPKVLLNDKKACAFMEQHAQEKKILDHVTTEFIKLADNLLEAYEKSAYKTPLNVFPWGSNSECANRGIVLATAYHVTGNQKYLEAAQAALHYILGRNPLDYCYVTGFGSKSPVDPHDRRSVADSIPLPAPGYLAGGPFVGGGFEVGQKPNKFPALNYYDQNGSFTTNEIAINWQAALILLAVMVDNE